MKKLVFLSVCCLAIFFTNAQVQRTPAAPATEPKNVIKTDKPAPPQRRDLMKELNLTPDQNQKMKTIREQGRLKRQSILTDSTLNENKKKEQLKALKADQENQIDKILTPEQKVKMDAVRAQMKEMRRNNQGQPGDRNENQPPLNNQPPPADVK